jgi:DNA-binding response OmpR family regulator
MKPENMTILTVDDTPANIRLLTHYLEKQGYRVITAEDGFEGFKAAIQYHPDLVLLDVMMPGTDGYEVCELLKAEEETKDIPVVFLTAKADVEDRVKGFELGAVDYITKPFNLVEISARVKMHLMMKYHEKLHKRTQKVMLQIQRATSLGKIGEIFSRQMVSGLNAMKKAPETAAVKKLGDLAQQWKSFQDLSLYENEAVDVNELLADVMDLVQFAHRDKLQIDFMKPAEAPSVFGNHGLLHQAVLCVLLNAAEVGNKISVQVSEETLPADLRTELKSEPSAGYAKIEVIDNGNKNDELQWNSAMELFLHSQKANDQALRLSAAKTIVQDHLGVLKTFQHENHGAKVQVFLPVHK